MGRDLVQERKLLRSARANGLLEPVFEELRSRAGKAEAPIEPEGAEWAMKRAYKDGRAAETLDFYSWMMMVAKPSPDEAENTEG